MNAMPSAVCMKGVSAITVFDFCLSVVAGVFSYYICKWLDRK